MWQDKVFDMPQDKVITPFGGDYPTTVSGQ
jgi:hypothetical protein